MKYLTTEFTEFYDDFIRSQLWADMKATVENSPYHREDNVAVHTNMVLDQVSAMLCDETVFYINDKEDAHFSRTDANILYVAALFHDVGKPASKEVVTRDDGTTYQRFPGHEQRSARMFNEFFFNNRDMFSEFRFSRNQLLYIQWLIENHLPYSLQKTEKVAALARDIVGMADFAEVNPNVFFAHLLSDTKGRIPDKSSTDEVIAWSKDMAMKCKYEASKDRATSDKYMTIIIGPSGARQINSC